MRCLKLPGLLPGYVHSGHSKEKRGNTKRNNTCKLKVRPPCTIEPEVANCPWLNTGTGHAYVICEATRKH